MKTVYWVVSDKEGWIQEFQVAADAEQCARTMTGMNYINATYRVEEVQVECRTNREWLVKMGREIGFITRPYSEPDPNFTLPEPDENGISWVGWQDNATHGELIGVDASDQVWFRGYGPYTDKSVLEPVDTDDIDENIRRWDEYAIRSWGYDEPRKGSMEWASWFRKES